MPGAIPTDTEWNQVQSDVASVLNRLTQVEGFNGEMDGRQNDTEKTVTDHEARAKVLESWKQSADATMNLAQKLGEDNKASIAALQTADTSIINRLKPLETWKPQMDSTVATHTSQLDALGKKVDGQATQLASFISQVGSQGTALTAAQSAISQTSARLDGMATFQGKLSDSLTALTKTVTDYIAATNARLAKLETPLPKTPEPPVQEPAP